MRCQMPDPTRNLPRRCVAVTVAGQEVSCDGHLVLRKRQNGVAGFLTGFHGGSSRSEKAGRGRVDGCVQANAPLFHDLLIPPFPV